MFQRRFSKAAGLLLALPLTLVLAAGVADARPGSGGSIGSRGARTYSAPAPTRTAPTPQTSINRSITQPSQPGVQAPGFGAQRPGGLFGGLGGGLLGGLAAGFLGAGLFGLLTGGGLFSGLGSLSGLFGFLLQIALLVFAFKIIRRLMSGQRLFPAGGPDLRTAYNQPGYGGSGYGPAASARPQSPPGPSDQLGLNKGDFDQFERLLNDIQLAFGREDVAALRSRTTPEMSSYFEQDLGANEQKGVRNTISNVQLLQGDLSEAWREGPVEYATVAMRFALVDQMVDRRTGQIVGGQPTPVEAVELWTFRREPQNGMRWVLSAIQQG